MKSKRIKSKENTPFKKSSEENHATKKTGYINRVPGENQALFSI